jgi:hypothetical protein
MQQPQLVKQYANAFSSQTMNDHQLIQLHLQLVETVLRNKDVSKLTEQQRFNRIQHLNNLHHYWNTYIYPINNKIAKRNPVFIDDYNTFCAVGYLMKTSGYESLARSIAAGQNLSYLLDIKAPGLNEWVGNSGLTQEELAWIQPGYIYENDWQPLGKGVNGPVYALAGDDETQILYVGGSFTIANHNVSCNNIVAVNYNNEDIFSNTFTPLGSGFNGPVKTLFRDGSNLYAGGDFDSSGNTPMHSIAKWNGTTWEALGNINGTVNCITKYLSQLLIGGSFTFTSNGQTYQNLATWDGNEWKPFNNYMNGAVNAFGTYDDILIVGGAFTEIDTTHLNYICTYHYQQLSSLGQGLKAPINTLSIWGSELYTGGPFISIHSDTTYGLSSYSFNRLQWEYNLVRRNQGEFGFDSTSYIKSISGPYIAGRFSIGFMYRSINSGIIDGDQCLPFASTNGDILSILVLGKRVFFGGEFGTSNIGVWDPDYVGLRTVDPLQERFLVSPNPTTNETSVSAKSAIQSLCIYDVSGKKIMDQIPAFNQTDIQLPRSTFPSTGLYFIQLKTESGELETQKLLVE